MKTTKLLLCAVSIAAAVVASKAHSQSFEVIYKDPGISPGIGVVGSINGNVLAEPGFPSGVMNFTDAPGGDVIADFQAFCVEPQIQMDYGTQLVYTVSTTQLQNSDTISLLIAAYLASGDSSDLNAAAVQWAIWEVTNESVSSSYSLLDGDVFITDTDTSIAAAANNYFTLIQNPNLAPVALTYLTNDQHQDVVTWNLVPEPGSAALALLSIAALIGRRRR